MPVIDNYEDIAEILCWSPRKVKNLQAKAVAEFTLTEGLASMFEREGYPETVNTKLLERFLIKYGIAAITTYSGNNPIYTGAWMAARCDIGGAPDPDGFGEKAICTFGDGTVKEIMNWRYSDDVIVCWNAWDYSLDLNIPDTARKIMVADTSLDMLVKNSRLHPIPVARDSKEKAAIEEVQINIIDGKEQTVLAQGETQEILDAIGNSQRQIETLQITDPNAAVHIQNITQYREDLLRWFWNIYGMDSRGTSKRAQQSVEEVDQGGDLSMVIPLSRWRARQEEADEVSRKCGVTATCDFSTCWKSRIVEAITMDTETAEKLDVEEVVEEFTKEEENADSEAVAASSEGATTEASADAEGEDKEGGDDDAEKEDTV